MTPKARRLDAWRKLVCDLDAVKLDKITREITLGEALVRAQDIIEGKVRGRLVVNVNA